MLLPAPFSTAAPFLTCGLALFFATQPAAQEGAAFRLEDRFGRPLDERGITLVDWEGILANPRVELVVRPADGTPAGHYPLRVTVRASSPRLLLQRFSQLSDEGSRKTLLIEAPGAEARFELAVFGDADGEDETHELVVELEDARESPTRNAYRVRVQDRDIERAPGMPIQLDFSFDETGFFQDEAVRALTARAANELADFLDEQGFAPVEPGAEVAFVWNQDGFREGHEVTFAEGYSGFTVLFHGIHHAAGHSGSCASDRRADALQRRGEETTGLRRSGTISMETSGNWNGLGWYLDDGDPNAWMRSRNLDADRHDYVSIVRHELMHALCYHPAHPAFTALIHEQTPDEKVLVDEDLRAYLGRDPALNDSMHLFDTLDPVSGFGAQGNEYGSRFPWRRWLPTKTDLLVLRAAGYRLRPHSALTPLALSGPAEASSTLSTPFALELALSGGVPDYHLRVVEGSLPPGLALDSYTGGVSGTPSEAGTFEATFELCDQDFTAPSARHALRFQIAAEPPVEPPAKPSAPPSEGGGARQVQATGGNAVLPADARP